MGSPLVNIITACTRPENLAKMLPEIENALDVWNIVWWIVYDAQVIHQTQVATLGKPYVQEIFHGHPTSVSGKAQLNFALDRITSGFVYVLDDDNTLHPALKNLPLTAGGYIFQQQLEGGAVRDIDIRPSKIDQAQFLLSMDIIGDLRYDLCYDADGKFISQIYNQHADMLQVVHEPLCYYNHLLQGSEMGQGNMHFDSQQGEWQSTSQSLVSLAEMSHDAQLAQVLRIVQNQTGEHFRI
ncbi:hypothetical protein CYMTET_30313 [Cymbomonas tetramitiformis]|uniref:Uncharacterized protein n=1 Tax=Cymbomonas tetramitiformis TaxID=36881 RepID=A0AAE0FJ92_9CHLO|nr:hypothetical protein CYMTET_30313 [Cymbomonas tetramitiformis]